MPGEVFQFHEVLWLGEGVFNINGNFFGLNPKSIIHVWSDDGRKGNATVQITSIDVCKHWRQAKWLRYRNDPRVTEMRHRGSVTAINLDTSPLETVLTRGFSMLGWRDYDLLNANCGHFAAWCKTGIPISFQLEQFALTRKTKDLVALLPKIPMTPQYVVCEDGPKFLC